MEFTENQTDLIALSFDEAEALSESNLVIVTPTMTSGLWSVTPQRLIGVATLGDLEVSIRPKLPIRRLLFLLGYAYDLSAWRDDPVAVSEDDDLIPAIAAAFARQAQRAVEQGLLQGYHELEESEPVLRGRLRTGDQMRRRYGLTIPLEVRYDDYSVDIPENRILRTAAERLLRIPGIHRDTRQALLRLVRDLADVLPLPRGGEIPLWQASRLNTRYHPALRLGELVLHGGSFDQGRGRVFVDGFMLNMATLFEQFLTTALRQALAPFGGAVVGQSRWHLDHEEGVALRPDIVWREHLRGRPLAVIDAKYKAEKPSGYPNADVYQMLAYCIRLGLDEGHLVYAKGEASPGRHHVVDAGIVIVRHALNLECDPGDLLQQVNDLADRIAGRPRLRPRVAGADV